MSKCESFNGRCRDAGDFLCRRTGRRRGANATVTVKATFDSVSTLTARFTGGTPGNSLVAQLGAAKDAAARGNANPCNAALNAYQNELAAQTGKALTAAQAATLHALANALRP